MSAKTICKIGIGLAMAGLMLFLLSYPLTRGLLRHGVCGFLLLSLFVCHHFLNARWYRVLFIGRWLPRRVLVTGTDLLLLGATIMTIAGCLLMAGDVFAFAPFPMTWWARSLHTASTAWLFIISAVHLGLHWRGLWDIGLRFLGRAWIFAAAAIWVAGIFGLEQSGILANMFLLEGRRPIPETGAQFLGQYLGIAMAFCLFPNLMLSICKNFIKFKRKPRKA